MASRVETIREFCQGFAAGALLQPAAGSEAWQDGWAHGRLSCRAAVCDYLRNRGLRDLGESDLGMFLPKPEASPPNDNQSSPQ